MIVHHCLKSVQIFSGPNFPGNLRIQSECWKIRTRKTSILGHFSAVHVLTAEAEKKLKNISTRWEPQQWKSVTFGKINFTKSNKPPWVFFTFLKLHKWFQIAQHTTSVVSAKLLRSCTEISSISLKLRYVKLRTT